MVGVLSSLPLQLPLAGGALTALPLTLVAEDAAEDELLVLTSTLLTILSPTLLNCCCGYCVMMEVEKG